jgi:flagellar hook-associated protein 2
VRMRASASSKKLVHMGAITFSGLGSGIDVDSIVTALVKAESGGINTSNTRITAAQAAVSSLSSIGGLLSDLKSVVDSMDTATELAGFTGTSGKPDALTLTTSGTAAPGSYSVRVVSLLKEQRNYSSLVDSRLDDLNKTGTLQLTQAGTTYDVNVTAADSLDEIAVKINNSGAKIKANVFFDGSKYRLQLKGSEGGAAGAFAINDVTDSLGFGFDASDSKKQDAADAEILVDGLTVKSKTNTISGAIEGVSFQLSAETTDSFNVKVASDPSKLTASLKSFVQKYNAVVNKVHSVAGFGSIKASDAALAGDSGLRAVAGGLGTRILSRSGQGGTLDTLADLGIRLNADGTLRLDDTTMNKALTERPQEFTKVLAGTDSKAGIMDLMSDMLKGFTASGTGLIAGRSSSFTSRIKTLQDGVTREQARLDRLETRLRKTYSAMDASVAQSKNSLSYLYNMG